MKKIAVCAQTLSNCACFWPKKRDVWRVRPVFLSSRLSSVFPSLPSITSELAKAQFFTFPKIFLSRGLPSLWLRRRGWLADSRAGWSCRFLSCLSFLSVLAPWSRLSRRLPQSRSSPLFLLRSCQAMVYCRSSISFWMIRASSRPPFYQRRSSRIHRSLFWAADWCFFCIC